MPMPMPSAAVEVYRNLTRRAWSVRVGGRVVGHVQAVALAGVTLRSSDAARQRCLRTGARDVHAWARGFPLTGVPRPAGAVRFRYRLAEPGFRLSDGTAFTAAAACWFEGDGSAWCLAPRGAQLETGGIPMRLRDLTPRELADVAERRARVRESLAGLDAPWVPDAAAVDAAPFLDLWEARTYPGTDRPCLRGLCWGHPDLGDAAVTTSVIARRGPGWVITEGADRLYVLGREDRRVRPSPVLSGRRGAYRPHPQHPQPGPRSGTDDDLPPLDPGIL